MQVPRFQNLEAEEVARQASLEEGTRSLGLKVEVQKHPSIEEFHTFVIQAQRSWKTSILSFLRDGRHPADVDKARKVRKRVAKFRILNDILYKRDISMPYLRCVEEDEAKYILEEVHEGICGDHTCLRSLVNKIIRASYF